MQCNTNNKLLRFLTRKHITRYLYRYCIYTYIYIHIYIYENNKYKHNIIFTHNNNIFIKIVQKSTNKSNINLIVRFIRKIRN